MDESLSPETIAKLEALLIRYGVTQSTIQQIVAGFDFTTGTPDDLLALIRPQLASLDQANAAFASSDLMHVISDAYASADVAIASFRLGLPLHDGMVIDHGRQITTAVAPRLTETAARQIALDWHQTFKQQTTAVAKNVEDIVRKGWRQGMGIEDAGRLQKRVLAEGITALQRNGQAPLSLEATAKAIVQTRVNELVSETHLDRYREQGFGRVKYQASDLQCTFHGPGGTCPSLTGTEFSVDQIPDYARIPRHLYSKSRWLPVAD